MINNGNPLENFGARFDDFIDIMKCLITETSIRDFSGDDNRDLRILITAVLVTLPLAVYSDLIVDEYPQVPNLILSTSDSGTQILKDLTSIVKFAGTLDNAQNKGYFSDQVRAGEPSDEAVLSYEDFFKKMKLAADLINELQNNKDMNGELLKNTNERLEKCYKDIAAYIVAHQSEYEEFIDSAVLEEQVRLALERVGVSSNQFEIAIKKLRTYSEEFPDFFLVTLNESIIFVVPRPKGQLTTSWDDVFAAVQAIQARGDFTSHPAKQYVKAIKY